jgi:hypothetical protein
MIPHFEFRFHRCQDSRNASIDGFFKTMLPLSATIPPGIMWDQPHGLLYGHL